MWVVRRGTAPDLHVCKPQFPHSSGKLLLPNSPESAAYRMRNIITHLASQSTQATSGSECMFVGRDMLQCTHVSKGCWPGQTGVNT